MALWKKAWDNFLHPFPSWCFSLPWVFLCKSNLGKNEHILSGFEVLGKFPFFLCTLFQHKLRWGMLILDRRTGKNSYLGFTRSPRREVTISHITLAQNNCYIVLIVGKRKGARFTLCIIKIFSGIRYLNGFYFSNQFVQMYIFRNIWIPNCME